ILIIGAGPAGLMCAIKSAQRGFNVTIIDHNEKIGKKLFITGKGRCNISNISDLNVYKKKVITNYSFVEDSLKLFTPNDVISFFEENNCPLKIERGNRIFPKSDKSSDIIKTFEKLIKKLNINLILNESVLKFNLKNNKIIDIITNKNIYSSFDYIVIATGGKSYPKTGSDGSMYNIIKQLGHDIIKPVPSLVGIEVKSFSNISSTEQINISKTLIENVKLKCKSKNFIFEELGDIQIFNKELDGPLIIKLSSLINRMNLNELSIYIDFKPALSIEQLKNRIDRELSINNNLTYYNLFCKLLPKSIVPLFIKSLKINGSDKIIKSNFKQINNNMVINSFIKSIKSFEIKISKFLGFDRAIVTSGGVNFLEINKHNFQSKIINNLYFCGEVLDYDAQTGGYNLQLALATGNYVGSKIV
ncbi:MAG: NAD(P)/FAD-dependent oxidoreductase, partial [Clostridia bacterium]|nr:NAD(P)/FAD-dependent oxidoreductase [Clostridia bacterium]